jgi:uncharacterized membrane protein
MRIASTGHALLAITLAGLGILGFLCPAFVPIWNPITASVPAHNPIIYLGSIISLSTGVGLLFRHSEAMAARSLVATFFLWLVLFRLPNFFRAPLFEACWSVFPLAVMLAAAWVLYVRFASNWDHTRLSFVSGISGLRVARFIYGLSLAFFGSAHFIDIKDTLSLVPSWAPGHLFWAYFTGAAFIASGIAVLTGFCARLAAALSALEIGLFLFLVWIPIVVAGSRVPFEWSETILNTALLAGAWTIADSYRGAPWVGIRTES